MWGFIAKFFASLFTGLVNDWRVAEAFRSQGRAEVTAAEVDAIRRYNEIERKRGSRDADAIVASMRDRRNRRTGGSG